MLRWRKAAAAVAIAATAALTFAGCAAGDQAGSGEGGGTLTLGAIAAPTTFDPAGSEWGNRAPFYQAVYDTLLLATAGLSLTLVDSLLPVVLGLACIATAMFAGYTATQLGVGDVARTDRGSASALYFSAYYAFGALGAYVPGLAWEAWGWWGVSLLGLGTLTLAAAGLAGVRASAA